MNFFFWAWVITSIIAFIYCMFRPGYFGHFILLQLASGFMSAMTALFGALGFLFVCVFANSLFGGDTITQFAAAWNVVSIVSFVSWLIYWINVTEGEILQQRRCQEAEEAAAEQAEEERLEAEEERLEAVRCDHCGRDEAIELVGQETLSQEKKYETVMRRVYNWGEMPNPNFMQSTPYSHTDYNQYIPVTSSTDVPQQILVTYTKVRDVYKCKFCKHKHGEERIVRQEGGPA